MRACLVAEQELGQRAGELGLAHARRAQEDERSGRTVRVFETGPRAADGPGHGLDRFVLAHDALVQLLFHLQQTMGLGLGELGHRDAGPHGRHLGDLVLTDGDLGVLVGLPPLLFQLVPLVQQLALAVAERSGLLEVLGVDGRFLLAAHFQDGVLDFPEVRGGAHVLDALARRGFVDEVDGLVGQEAVADVAVGQVGRGFQGLVGDAHPMVRLVALAQTLEDLAGLLDARLFHQDLLEAALESRVLLQVLAVFVERGGADGLQLAPGQSRLEDGGRVDGAFSRAGAHEVVDLVDEQDDVAALGDLFHDLLEALLELAAVLGAGDQGAQVERVDLLVLEDAGHVVLGDALGQALDDGGLAHARLAHEHRVVLGAASEDLHDPLDLGLAADDRVELVLLRVLRQVAAELVEHLGALALLAAFARLRGRRARAPLRAAGGTGQHPHDFLTGAVGVDVQVVQDTGRHALALPHEAEEDVLGAYVVVAQRQRLAQRQLQHLLGARRERDLSL